jgi:hypothetical protein
MVSFVTMPEAPPATTECHAGCAALEPFLLPPAGAGTTLGETTELEGELEPDILPVTCFERSASAQLLRRRLG